MMQRLWHWWPILPAGIILYFGAISFQEKFPKDANLAVNVNLGQAASDSVLEFIQSEGLKTLGHTDSSTSAIDSTSRVKNPFRSARGPTSSGDRVRPGVKPDPPWRKYVLKGTVGNQVATIADRNGRKMILKVGDSVDSATVISIETNKVILKDRAGKFELLPE